jgi:hypothetical protein
MAKLTELSRKDNATAMEEFRKRGIIFIKPTAADEKYYTEIGIQARRGLVGRLYTQEFLTRVEEDVAAFRKANPLKEGK